MTDIHHTQNGLLIALSYVISVLGSYTALQLALDIPGAKTAEQRRTALLASGAAMGGGAIWAMHFIAMLGCEMAMPVSYDVVLTLVSALVGIVSCIVGLAIVSGNTSNWGRLVAAGTVMGLGVGGMHYMGMAAMLMPATTVYDMGIVALSLVIAVAASIAALWLAFHTRGWVQLLGSAMVMGIAVCGMHYTGMSAATFVHDEHAAHNMAQGMAPESLGATIFTIAAVLLLTILFVNNMQKQRRAAIQI
ncbi:MHYT domain-containing protein (plasmid) [Ralstonia sp. 25C]|uniref:MHYT domain-containing protein n=1 Tax=Ralstonia sp. 25C TaxID=3447363 RepID=UPI003F756C3B